MQSDSSWNCPCYLIRESEEWCEESLKHDDTRCLQPALDTLGSLVGLRCGCRRCSCVIVSFLLCFVYNRGRVDEQGYSPRVLGHDEEKKGHYSDQVREFDKWDEERSMHDDVLRVRSAIRARVLQYLFTSASGVAMQP